MNIDKSFIAAFKLQDTMSTIYSAKARIFDGHGMMTNGLPNYLFLLLFFVDVNKKIKIKKKLILEGTIAQ